MFDSVLYFFALSIFFIPDLSRKPQDMNPYPRHFSFCFSNLICFVFVENAFVSIFIKKLGKRSPPPYPNAFVLFFLSPFCYHKKVLSLSIKNLRMVHPLPKGLVFHNNSSFLMNFLYFSFAWSRLRVS